MSAAGRVLSKGRYLSLCIGHHKKVNFFQCTSGSLTFWDPNDSLRKTRQFHSAAESDRVRLAGCPVTRLGQHRYPKHQNKHRNIPGVIQQSASISSLGLPVVPNFVRDLLQTGQLNPPNPLLVHIQDLTKYSNHQSDIITNEDGSRHPPLPKFSSIEPRHLESALRQLLDEYDENRQILETNLTNLLSENNSDFEYEKILWDLDNLDFPLRYFRRLTELMRSVGHGGEDMKQIIPHLFQMIDEHSSSQSYSFVVIQTFEKLLDQLNDRINSDNADVDLLLLKERKRLLETFITEFKLRGGELSIKDENFVSLQSRLEELEQNFSRHSRKNNGNPPPARESVPLMYEILAVKKYMAEMMGYSNFAECCLIDRMAPDLDIIQSLHYHISEKTKPIASSIVSGQTAMENAGLDGHFVLDDVLSGLFDLSSTLFGIHIKQVETSKEDIDLWNPDVRFFHVFDKDNEDVYIGSFYLDPFARPYKQGGEWMGPIFDKRGKTMTPLVFLSCYMNPPVWDDSPVRMSFSDVKGLFHEFGHMLQFLLLNVEYGSFSGPNSLEKDANEFPSQFMEYWLYDRDVLTLLLPDGYPIQDIQEKLILQRKHESALKFSVQSFLGQLELDLHSTFDPSGETSIFNLQNKLAQSYTPYDIPNKGDLSSLHSIFQTNADGYHMASYRYLWSEVMSADAFHAFQEQNEGLGGGEAHKKTTGRKFRKTILEAGASLSARESFQNFRGRDADVNALLFYHGLSEEKQSTSE